MSLIQQRKDIWIIYRTTGFNDVKDCCEQMNTKSMLKEKRLGSTKRYIVYESADEPIQKTIKILEVSFMMS